MEITIQGKQMDVGDALKTHVEDRITDIVEKYFNNVVFVTVNFSREGHGHQQTKAHISIKLGKDIFIVSDVVTNDPYASFDAAAEKVGKQLRRYKKKLRDHHESIEKTPENEIMKARAYVLATGQEEEQEEEDTEVPSGDDPVVIAEMPKEILTMSVSDAVMRLDLSGESVLMFRNPKHNGLTIVYRRTDGNLGWIDPENIEKAS